MFTILIPLIYFVVLFFAIRNSWVWKNMQDVRSDTKISAQDLHLFMMCKFWVWDIDNMRKHVKVWFKK